MIFLYTAWFRNNYLNPNDQDYEWPACFLIEAPTKEKALKWGDYHSNKRNSNNDTEVFLNSKIETIEEQEINLEELRIKLPLVTHGKIASDNDIGW